MKNKFLSLLSISVILTLIAGCEPSHRHRKHSLPAKEVVQTYRVSAVTTNSDVNATNMLYLYLIQDKNTSNSYYSFSPILITDKSAYSKLNWQKLVGRTLAEIAKSVEKLGDIEIDTDELGEADTEIESDYTSMEDSEVGDVGGGDADVGGDSGGDSGAGDAGGGDGGGGGE